MDKGSGSGRPKKTGFDRIRIRNPGFNRSIPNKMTSKPPFLQCPKLIEWKSTSRCTYNKHPCNIENIVLYHSIGVDWRFYLSLFYFILSKDILLRGFEGNDAGYWLDPSILGLNWQINDVCRMKWLATWNIEKLKFYAVIRSGGGNPHSDSETGRLGMRQKVIWTTRVNRTR